MNFGQAESFLKTLDESASTWTFQTFSDNGDKSPRLTKVLHGTLDQHRHELEQLNDQGSGVFVTVNETDGKGRKANNITKIRALYVDLDGAPLGPVMAAPTPPHIVVQTSPDRFHAYWKVTDCPINYAQTALSKLIQRFDGDPRCKDVSRVLRVPGFFHLKADPFLVQVIETNPGEFTLADLLLGADLQKSTNEHRGILKITEVINNHLCSSVLHQSSSVGADEIARFMPRVAGDRNFRLFHLTRFLKGHYPESSPSEFRAIVKAWHEDALPVIGTQDFATTWTDFQRGWASVRSPLGINLKSIIGGITMSDPIPADIAELGYGEKTWLLIRICRELQKAAGSEPFFLSARTAADLIDVHFTDAAKMLYSLSTDEIIDLVSKGSGVKASRYRYRGLIGHQCFEVASS